MVSSVLSCLVSVLCVILLPAVRADFCSSYWDTDGVHHDSQQCVTQNYCCGNCNQKYCCREKQYSLTQEKQERCPRRPSDQKNTTYTSKKNSIAFFLGSILGTIFSIVLGVGLIICCVAPCCLFYKKCGKGRNRTVRNTTTVNAPQQPHSPSGYLPYYPGYQPVPVHTGYGGPAIPTAPSLSDLEATDPAHSPVASTLGLPMYSLPDQPYPDELAQLPYNPAYC